MSGVIENPIGRPEEIGTFNNIRYLKYRGRFTGETASGRFNVPYEITTPANPREGSRIFVFEPLHFSGGTVARDGYLGPDFLFVGGISHATVRHKNFRVQSLERDPLSPLTLRSREYEGPEVVADNDILREFATALRQSSATSFIGKVARLYAIGFSDSGNTVHQIYKPFGHKLFDITFACTAGYVEPVNIAGQKPIIVFNTEADFDPRAVPNPAFPQYRWYTVAGGGHIPDAALTRQFFPNPPEAGSPAPPVEGTSPINWLPFVRAIFAAGDQWVRNNVQPPPSVTLKLTSDGLVLRDDKGNALGGIRHPALEMREAVFMPSVIRGNWALFGGYGSLRKRLQPNEFAGYLGEFTKKAEVLVGGRYLMPAGRDRMIAQAKLNPPNTFTRNYQEERFFVPPPPPAPAPGLND